MYNLFLLRNLSNNYLSRAFRNVLNELTCMRFWKVGVRIVVLGFGVLNPNRRFDVLSSNSKVWSLTSQILSRWFVVPILRFRVYIWVNYQVLASTLYFSPIHVRMYGVQDLESGVRISNLVRYQILRLRSNIIGPWSTVYILGLGLGQIPMQYYAKWDFSTLKFHLKWSNL